MPRSRSAATAGISLALALGALPAAAAEPSPAAAAIEIRRLAGEIVIDGRLDEPAWDGAAPVETWFETRPGDNVEPKVGNRAYLVYDDRFLYAGFEFQDGSPESIRAPLANRDNVPSYTDYGGRPRRRQQRRPHRPDVPGQRARHPVRRDHQRRLG